MDWQSYIEDCYNTRKSGHGSIVPEFYPPASEESMEDLCFSLGIKLPSELEELLRNTNGVMELMELDEQLQAAGWLVWPTEEIKRVNSWYQRQDMQEAYHRSFSDLLFFASADVGLFASSVPATRIEDSGIYIWYSIDNEIKEVASSLRAFIEQRVCGKMVV